MKTLSGLFLVVVTLLLCLPSQSYGACECGYQDPITGHLWTDATITYFNETGMADTVIDVQESASILGMGTAGNTGTGQQAWSVVGNHINKWEDSFGAIYRSAVSFNNTYTEALDLGLAMQVSTANNENHIVNGSQIVTRRRDILYGSFRAFIIPAASTNLNGGSAFQFGVSYNTSESVDLSIMTSDRGLNNHTLDWSFSATSKDAAPVFMNLSYANPGVNEQIGLEHRIDWTNDQMIALSNNGTNSTANHISYVKNINATNLPSTPAPVSFQTWSNGEPSVSMGPPQLAPSITHILYTRFFYNSSLPERWTQYSQQCQASLPNSVCSTDDSTLRNSTIFIQESTAQVVIPSTPFSPPRYAIIAASAAVGFMLILLLHMFAVRGIFRTGKHNLSMHPVKETKSQALPKSTSWSDPRDESSEMEHVANSSSTHIAERILLARSSSYAVDSSRRSSISGGPNSSLGHSKFNASSQSLARPASLSRRNSFSRPSLSSRPASFIHGHSDRPRDITDLDMMFDGWDSDGGYDSEEFEQADRISGNFERYDEDEKKMDHDGSAENYIPEMEILPRFAIVDNSQETTSNSSNSKGGDEENRSSPIPRLVHWQIRGREDTNLVGQLAEPAAIQDAQEIAKENDKDGLANYPSLVQVFMKRIDNFFFVERTKVRTSTGQLRIDYLDGMRGAACILVSLGHFSLIFYIGISNTGAPAHYVLFERWYRNLFGAISNNPSLLLGIFFALPSRTMCQRYLTRGGLGGMADTTVRRIPRLMFPVAAAATIEYFLIDVNAFKWVRRLASRTWSVWSYWQEYDNCLVFFNAVITLPWGTPPASPALVTGYATGVLWTIPVIINGMWTCMVATLIAYEIKNPFKRFTFYFLAVLFSWYANTWDCYFLTGLIVGDLDSNLRYREKAAKGFPIPIPSFSRTSDRKWMRIHGKYLCYAFLLACCTEQWMTYAYHGPLRVFNNIEHAIHPDWLTSQPYIWENQLGYAGFTSPAIFGFFLILGLFTTADMSSIVQKFFRLRVFHWLGIHAMSIYLLHGIVWWTWAAWLVLAMLTAGAPYWAATLVALFTGYTILFAMCICFTYTFEVWATLLAKSIWRATSGKLGRRV